MRLLKFFLKYYLFHSISRKKNIERIIEDQGFGIFRFRLESKNSAITKTIEDLNAIDYAQHHDAFITHNPIGKCLFIKKGMTALDELDCFFHEEAHIWYDHPFRNGFTDHTNRQQEKVANFFLFRLRLLKAATYILFFAALLSPALLLLHPLKGAAVADEDPQTVLQTAAYTAPEEDPIPADLLISEASAEPAIESTGATVYITPSGERYHRPDCYHIKNRTTLPLTIPEAEQFNKTPCKTCQP